MSFVFDPHVVPVQAPIHRIPVTKRERVKLKLDEMVRDGKLAKVEEPTDWCSNMTVVERIKSVHRCDSSVALCYSYGIHLILDVRYCTSHPYKRMCFLIIRAEQYCKSLNFLAIAIGL